MKTKWICGLLAAMMMTTALPTAALANEEPEVLAPNPVIAVKPLEDVPTEHWAREAVDRMMNLGIMAPVKEQTFAPQDPFTRESLVMALWYMSGKPVVNGILTFEDVEQDAQAAEAIRWAAAEGIVSGYNEKTFGPQDSITREQLAKIIYAYVKKYDMGFHGMWMFHLAYEDADAIAQWAFEPMHWMVASRIMQGVTPTQLMPQGTVTRAQGAVMLSRLLDVAAEKNVDFLQYGAKEG